MMKSKSLGITFYHMAAVLLRFLCVGLLTNAASAHELNPIVVNIEETSSSAYSLSLVVPTSMPVSDAPIINISPKCEANPQTFIFQQNGYSTQYQCKSTSPFTSVSLDFPNGNPSLTTIVELTQGRESFVKVLTPGQLVAEFEAAAGPLDAKGFLDIGFDHILQGWDHLLFILAVIVLLGLNRTLIFSLTGFTIGHAVSILAIDFKLIAPFIPYVELLIVLSILLLAVDIIRNTPSLLRRRPILLTTLIGLIHGCGFASYFRQVVGGEFDLGATVFFNLGVELGQLTFVCVIAITALMGRFVFSILFDRNLVNQMKTKLPQTKKAVGYSIGVVSTFWFTQLILGV